MRLSPLLINAQGNQILFMMTQSRQPEWKATTGYTINAVSGIAEKGVHYNCTLYFYLANPGDVLHLIDDDYEYAVATYAPDVEAKYIYTYDYQPEESWTTYRRDFSVDQFTQEDYVFTKKAYFRVVLRRKETAIKNVTTGNDLKAPLETPINLPEILQWRKREQEKPCRSGLFEAEVRETVRAVCEKQGDGTLNFIILSDTHYTVNGTWEDTADNLRRVSKALEAKGVKLDGIIHLGDATDGLLPAELTRHYVMETLADLRALGYPFYYVPGNHDSNYFRGNPERFTMEEMRDLYLPGYEHLYYDIVIDFTTPLRMIFLDSFDPGEQVRYGFHDQELEWLENLLGQTPPDWKVLVFSHVPPAARLHYWSDVIRGSGRLLRILRRYQARTGGLMGFVHGHNHADQIDYEEGFPIISIGCNKCEYFPDKKPEGAIAYKRELQTVTQDLWDVCVVSPKTGDIDLVRFGAGEDRHIIKKAKKDRETETPMKKVITY